MHPVDAIPDTDASAGLLITFILEQQAWKKQSGEAVGLHRKAVIQKKKAFRYIIGLKRRFWLDSQAQTQGNICEYFQYFSGFCCYFREGNIIYELHLVLGTLYFFIT